MKAENIKERICLGVIAGVHGIRGEVKVKSFTSDDRDIEAYGALENKDASSEKNEKKDAFYSFRRVKTSPRNRYKTDDE